MPEPNDPTPSELLMKVFDEFSAAEPREVAVIWTNQNDELCFSTTAYRTQAVGMCEATKNVLLSKMTRDE